jgi:hypothetical protein
LGSECFETGFLGREEWLEALDVEEGEPEWDVLVAEDRKEFIVERSAWISSNLALLRMLSQRLSWKDAGENWLECCTKRWRTRMSYFRYRGKREEKSVRRIMPL